MRRLPDRVGRKSRNGARNTLSDLTVLLVGDRHAILTAT